LGFQYFSRRLEYNFAPSWSSYPAMYFVELFWTLKGHSLGQSEDHVKVTFCPHFILFDNILEVILSYGCFRGDHFWGQMEFFRLIRFLPSRVFFNGKLVIHSPKSYILATLAHYKGIISYPAKVKV
jgi:hypothetical protein